MTAPELRSRVLCVLYVLHLRRSMASHAVQANRIQVD